MQSLSGNVPAGSVETLRCHTVECREADARAVAEADKAVLAADKEALKITLATAQKEITELEEHANDLLDDAEDATCRLEKEAAIAETARVKAEKARCC